MSIFLKKVSTKTDKIFIKSNISTTNIFYNFKIPATNHILKLLIKVKMQNAKFEIALTLRAED